MKHIDFAVIGGSYAGLSAALQLARARRQVLVVDAGLRRNRFVDQAGETSHGFLTKIPLRMAFLIARCALCFSGFLSLYRRLRSAFD